MLAPKETEKRRCVPAMPICTHRGNQCGTTGILRPRRGSSFSMSQWGAPSIFLATLLTRRCSLRSAKTKATDGVSPRSPRCCHWKAIRRYDTRWHPPPISCHSPQQVPITRQGDIDLQRTCRCVCNRVHCRSWCTFNDRQHRDLLGEITPLLSHTAASCQLDGTLRESQPKEVADGSRANPANDLPDATTHSHGDQ